MVKRMRELRPLSSAKILYYWHAGQSFKCYDSVNELSTQPHLWLNDTNGYPILHHVHHKVPFYDLRIPEARDKWIVSALDQVTEL